MSKRFGLTTCLLVLLMAVSAQQKLNYADVDQKSYELYNQQKWAELIDFADEARGQGIDYFYLQARTGIAYYNLKKYRKASEFLLKAWKNDQSFEWLQEYLYYSLVYSGRSVEASKYAAQFSVPVKVKINYQNMKPLRGALEIGYSFNPDFDALANRSFDEEMNVGSDYGEAFILKNYHFESMDYSHQLAPGVFCRTISHTSVSTAKNRFFGANEIRFLSISLKTSILSIQLLCWDKKWYVSPSANVIWGKSDLVLGNYDPNTFYSTTVKFSDFIFSTSTWGHFGNFAPGAEVNFANIYNDGFTLLSGWVTVYPLSNTNLYFTPRVYFKSDKENGFGYNTFGISGGAQLGPVHFYGQYLNGDMKNFIEPAGYVVANFPGRSEQKIMGSLYFPVAKKYQFVVRYINQDIIEKYNVYTSGTITNSLEYKYIKHTLTAGISWNF
jgi:tetratricopeptide (TPR) repeat protein